MLEGGVEGPGLEQVEEGDLRVGGAQHDRRVDLLTTLEDDASGAIADDPDPRDGRLGPDLGAERLRGPGDRHRDAAGPALGDAPRAERPVDLAHVVMEQDVRRPGRADALIRPDDPGRGHRRLERVGLEPLVEEVRRAHRHELDEDRLLALRQAAEGPRQADERQQRPRVEVGRVARHDPEDRLDEAGHLDHELAVLLVRLGVVEAPAAELADGPAVVVDPPQVVAATGVCAGALRQRRERAVERQDVKAVLGQPQLADDLGAEQADHVARDREAEAGDDLLGDRRTAEDVTPLEHDRAQARACQIGRRDQAVVAAADDDRVVGPGQRDTPPASIHRAYV